MGSSPARSTLAPVAQWLEQLTHNQLAVGSSPTGRTQTQVNMLIITKNNYMSPMIYAGLHYKTQTYIRHRTCFETGELAIIAASVCEVCNTSLEDLKKPTRKANLNDARKIFWHLARRLYLFTNRRLGKYLERDHSTVVVALRRCEDYLATDPLFKEQYIKALLETIRNLNVNGYENYRNTHKQIVGMTEIFELNKIRNEYRSDYDVRS